MKSSGMRKLLFASIFAFSCVSGSIAFMPYASEQKYNNFMLPVYIVGGVFWLSIIFGYGSLLVLNHKRNKNLKAFGINSYRKQRPGFLCAWSNLPAKIFDTLTVISLLGFIVTVLKFKDATQLIFGLMAVLFFSANMHGLFNGKNYKYIKAE